MVSVILSHFSLEGGGTEASCLQRLRGPSAVSEQPLGRPQPQCWHPEPREQWGTENSGPLRGPFPHLVAGGVPGVTRHPRGLLDSPGDGFFVLHCGCLPGSHGPGPSQSRSAPRVPGQACPPPGRLPSQGSCGGPQPSVGLSCPCSRCLPAG